MGEVGADCQSLALSITLSSVIKASTSQTCEEEVVTKGFSTEKIAKEKKAGVRGEVAGWSIFSILAFCIGFLGLILLIASLVLLIPAFRLSSQNNEKMQQSGFILSIAALFVSAAAVVSGFLSKKDSNNEGLRGKGLSIAAWIFGLIGFIIALVPVIIFFSSL